MKSLENRQWNRLDWGLRELDISAPNGMSVFDRIEWARGKLEQIAEDATEDKDRVAAARALLSSLHTQVEHLERAEIRKSTGSQNPSTPIQQLPRQEQIAAIEAARRQLNALEASLGLSEASDVKTLSAGQPGTVESISANGEDPNHEEDE